MTTLTMYPGRDLPPIIQRAISRANDPSVLQDLSPPQRWVLSILLRRVSADTSKNIFWVKRENFAKLIGASEATVYRFLSALERLGLIQRVAQKRSAEGEFTVGELRLTDSLCLLLGLTKENEGTEPSYYQRKKSDGQSSLQDGLYSNQENKQFSTKKQSDAESVEKKRKIGKIPEELKPLVTQGLSHAQVFKLMSICTTAGKRLSDVVAVCQAQLLKLRGNGLFAYIVSLALAEKDFAYIRQTRDAEQQIANEKDKIEKELKALQVNHQGGWFAQGTDTLFQAESNGIFSVYRHSGARWNCNGAVAGDAANNIWLRIKEGEIAMTSPPPYHLLS